MKFSFFALLLLLPLSVFAQGFEFGLGAGGYNYSGDITPAPKFRNFRPGGEVFLRYNFNAMLAARAGVQLGRVEANDANRPDLYKQARGVAFTADFMSADLRLEYNFRDFRAKSEFSRWCPYLFLGVGVAKFANEGTYRSRTLETPQVFVPFGVAMRYAMAYNWNVGLEVGTRFLFTDALDTIDEQEQLSKFQMGNPFTNDAVHYVGFSLSYTFEGVHCPVRFK